MFKYALLGLLLLLQSIPAVQALDNEKIENKPVVLKENVEVSSEYIKLGDIFENLSDNSEKQILKAPKVGRNFTLSAQDLLVIAKNNSIDWRPENNFVSLKITRLGKEISLLEIEQLIKDALLLEGIPEDYELVFANKNLSFFVPFEKEKEISITSFSYNPRNGQFIALAVAGNDETYSMRITGRALPTITIPVLTKNIEKGDVILETDVSMQNVRKDAAKSRAIADLSEIIGKEAKRNLYAGDFLNKDDLIERFEVQKGKLITVIFTIKNMMLSAQAKALENGTVGDVIKVINPTSKQVFAVTVTGNNAAEVKQVKI